MHSINPDIDIVAQVIEAVRHARPDDVFCQSIQQQYIERGSLSKKQLEGLLGKAIRLPGIPAGKLATLEAIIKKKLTKERSAATILPEVIKKTDAVSAEMIAAILLKYPVHKSVLLFKAKFDKDKILAEADKNELQKFYGLLVK